MTNESTNNTGINEIRALTAVELDAVSGGAMTKAFEFKVAGMSIAGAYDSSTGDYAVLVGYGDKGIVKTGQV